MTSKQISTIIVNYNAGALLRNCIDSLLNCPLNIEIIVVDNASKDGSLDALLGLPVVIVKNKKNLGFAAACNQGIKVAKAENILFLNPDCSFKPGTLAEILKELRADDKAGMAGGLLVNTDGSEQGGGRRALPTPWRSFVRAFGLTRFANRWPRLFYDFNLYKQELPEHSFAVEAISGACMMVKREALNDVGEWDAAYFLHCEDLDWCMRFLKKGWKILFVPTATITHELGACSKGRPIFVEWHKHKGMMRFYLKFFKHQYPGGLMALVAIGVWFRFLLVAIQRTSKRLGFGLVTTFKSYFL